MKKCKERLAAETAARRLVHQLGPEWRLRVWENLGWHWCVYNGGMKIHPGCSYDGGYTAFLSGDSSSGGIWAEYGKTAMSAMRNTLKKARGVVAQYNQVIASTKGLKIKP